jgi:hypothetical protein
LIVLKKIHSALLTIWFFLNAQNGDYQLLWKSEIYFASDLNAHISYIINLFYSIMSDPNNNDDRDDDITYTHLADVDSIMSKLDKHKLLHKRDIGLRFEISPDKTLIAYSTNKDARCVGKVEDVFLKGMIDILQSINVKKKLNWYHKGTWKAFYVYKGIMVSLVVDSKKIDVARKEYLAFQQTLIRFQQLGCNPLLLLHCAIHDDDDDDAIGMGAAAITDTVANVTANTTFATSTTTPASSTAASSTVANTIVNAASTTTVATTADTTTARREEVGVGVGVGATASTITRWWWYYERRYSGCCVTATRGNGTKRQQWQKQQQQQRRQWLLHTITNNNH